MSIASAIQNAQQKVVAAYTAIDNKGGTLPLTQDLSNMATAISSIPTGSSPVINTLTVTPSTSQQIITAPSGVDGYSPITVNGVTSSIDNNITAGNIKSGVTILGVTGNYSGVTPTGTLNITSNGTYDVTNYASASVNVSGGEGGGVGITREVDSNGAYGFPVSNFTFSLPSNATRLKSNALYYAFYGCGTITSADLSSLISLPSPYSGAMSYAFNGCNNLTSVDLSGLTSISATLAMSNTFSGCSNLTSIDLSNLATINSSNALYYVCQGCSRLSGTLDLSSLTTIEGAYAMNYAFRGCSSLTSIDLSNLVSVKGSSVMESTFDNCTNITSINFGNLTTIGYSSSSIDNSQFSKCFRGWSTSAIITFPKLEAIYCTGSMNIHATFRDCTSVKKFYFPKLTTITYSSGTSTSNQEACKHIFYGCTNLTELHFAAANQSAIEATAGYSTAWGRGAGNVTIYFDL